MLEQRSTAKKKVFESKIPENRGLYAANPSIGQTLTVLWFVSALAATLSVGFALLLLFLLASLPRICEKIHDERRENKLLLLYMLKRGEK